MTKTILFLTLSLIFTNVYAQDEEQVYSYDSIVDQLNSSNRTDQADVWDDPYKDVKFHIGAGFSQSILNVKSGSSSNAVTMSGIEIRFGVNLMNPQWLAEGTLRNYNDNRSDGVNYQLREFETKLIHTKPFSKQLFYRVGTGIAARYLKTNIENKAVNKEYTTPSLILLAGSGMKLTDHIAVSGDVAFKTSMVNDTVDKNTLDFTLRLDTSF
jgi:hypothetical protein